MKVGEQHIGKKMGFRRRGAGMIMGSERWKGLSLYTYLKLVKKQTQTHKERNFSPSLPPPKHKEAWKHKAQNGILIKLLIWDIRFTHPPNETKYHITSKGGGLRDQSWLCYSQVVWPWASSFLSEFLCPSVKQRSWTTWTQLPPTSPIFWTRIQYEPAT